MTKQRYHKTQHLKNNFYTCIDTQIHQTRLMKIIPVSKSQAQDMMQIIPTLQKIEHPNILKICDYFLGYEEQFFQGQQDENQIEYIRCIYIIMQKPSAFLYQYYKDLSKEQFSSIYYCLKSVIIYLHHNQLSGNILQQNIFLEANLKPAVYLEIKNIMNVDKIRRSMEPINTEQLQKTIQNDRLSDFKDFNFFIYQILKQYLLQEQYQEDDMQNSTCKKNNSSTKLTEEEIQRIDKIQEIRQKKQKKKTSERFKLLRQQKNKLKQFDNTSNSTLNRGGWSKLQMKKAYEFILKQKKAIDHDKLRNSHFSQMSAFIKSRNISQCKNLYRRILRKATSPSKIVEYSKKKLSII